jgi:hypothetical protein
LAQPPGFCKPGALAPDLGGFERLSAATELRAAATRCVTKMSKSFCFLFFRGFNSEMHNG